MNDRHEFREFTRNDPTTRLHRYAVRDNSCNWCRYGFCYSAFHCCDARHCAPDNDVLKVRKWTDANSAILYAPCYGRTSVELETGFLFTLKFDAAGSWKIVDTHRMSKKELEDEQ
jgi:hypothetical protein